MGIDTIKFVKLFLNFITCTDTQELIVKYNICLKTLLQQGISEIIKELLESPALIF